MARCYEPLGSFQSCRVRMKIIFNQDFKDCSADCPPIWNQLFPLDYGNFLNNSITCLYRESFSNLSIINLQALFPLRTLLLFLGFLPYVDSCVRARNRIIFPSDSSGLLMAITTIIFRGHSFKLLSERA